MRIEHEEYRSSELVEFKEMKVFEAEDYRNYEHIRLNMEEYRTQEIELRGSSLRNTTSMSSNIKPKTDVLKQGMKMLSSTLTTATVAVGAVVIGIVPTVSSTEQVDYGVIEVSNYYIDHSLNDTVIENDLVIKFENGLLDGYYLAVTNTKTNEVKYTNSNYIAFDNIGNEDVIFEINVLDNQEIEVETLDLIVSPKTPRTYQGVGQLDYDIVTNEDGTSNLKLYLEESNNLELIAFIKDLEGNYLSYESSFNDNTVTISNIIEEEFDIVAGAYRLEDGNYYSEKMYYLNSFNINNPSFIDLERVEILNMNYTIDWETIPTFIYFNGYLTANDTLSVTAYGESGIELGRVENITNLSEPIIFNGLPTDELVTFEYYINHREIVMSEALYETSLAVPEEYRDVEYTYYYANPGDGMYTYNDDNTYNYYVYSGFENNSEYEMIYKVELAMDMIPKYEYIGTDMVAEIINIKPNEYFSLLHKVMIKDGKNYYEIGNFYLASGTVGLEYLEDDSYSYIDIYANGDKTYTISSYIQTDGEVNVEVSLSNGEVLNLDFNSKELYDGKIIDLKEYEYDSLTIKVSVSGNPNYGSGDMILENITEVKGNLYLEFNEEYIE